LLTPVIGALHTNAFAVRVIATRLTKVVYAIFALFGAVFIILTFWIRWTTRRENERRCSKK
jgi:hypothetical protein